MIAGSWCNQPTLRFQEYHQRLTHRGAADAKHFCQITFGNMHAREQLFQQDQFLTYQLFLHSRDRRWLGFDITNLNEVVQGCLLAPYSIFPSSAQLDRIQKQPKFIAGSIRERVDWVTAKSDLITPPSTIAAFAAETALAVS